MSMKKIFTSMLLMAAAVVASAQNFTVTAFEGTRILKDGDVVECGYTEMPFFGQAWNPEIEVLCNKDLTLTVTANAPANQDVDFCGISGNCIPLTGTPDTRSKAYKEGENVPMKLEVHTGSVVTEPFNATLEITDGTETVNITITFRPEAQEELGIAAVAADGVSVAVIGRTLNFNTDSATDLTLYTISGQSAVSRRVSGRGTLNLTNLPAGVYIYRAGKKTGKFILR